MTTSVVTDRISTTLTETDTTISTYLSKFKFFQLEIVGKRGLYVTCLFNGNDANLCKATATDTERTTETSVTTVSLGLASC